MPQYLRTRRLVLAVTALLVVMAVLFAWWRATDDQGAMHGHRAGEERTTALHSPGGSGAAPDVLLFDRWGR
jgi:ferric-dicitrate binding protein FerR (iron transport regulator)